MDKPPNRRSRLISVSGSVTWYSMHSNMLIGGTSTTDLAPLSVRKTRGNIIKWCFCADVGTIDKKIVGERGGPGQIRINRAQFLLTDILFGMSLFNSPSLVSTPLFVRRPIIRVGDGVYFWNKLFLCKTTFGQISCIMFLNCEFCLK